MTTVYLAPTFGVGYQSFTNGGLPNNAGYINTYAAGGTTPQATYTTSAGNVQNANPIVLDASGKPPSEVWLLSTAYRFDVFDSLGNLIKTYDNIYGIVGPSSSFTNPTFTGLVTINGGPDRDALGHARNGIFQISAVTAGDGTYPNGRYDAYGYRQLSTMTAAANSGQLYGISSEPAFQSTGFTGTSVFSIYADITLNAGTAYTVTNAYNIFSDTASRGAGASITNMYGLYINNISGGTSLNYAIWTNTLGLVSFGDAVTCRSSLEVNNGTVGYVGIGGSPVTSRALRIAGTMSAGSVQYGITSEPTFSSATTSQGYGMMVQINTAAAAFTMSEAYGVRVLDASKGAASAITTQYGVYVSNLTAGSSNYAIYTQSGLVRFGDTLLTVVSTTAGPSLNLPHGTAPASPSNGDMWTTTSGLFVRINGSTVGPLS